MKAKSLPAGKHGDGRGLMLVKNSKVSGKWIFRYPVMGTKKRREMGLGRWPDVPLAEARDKADEARALLRNGIDPIADRSSHQHHQSGTTVAEIIESCFEARQAQLKNDGKAGRWLSPLSVHIIPKIGNINIEHVDQHVLRETLEPIWHTKPEAAAKALSRVGLSIKHAAALGLNVERHAVESAKELLGKQRRRVKHIRSMPYADVPQFYSWLTTLSGTTPLALRLLILTAKRTSEIRFASINEMDGDVWLLPKERTKTGREHKVPLSNEALKVIKTAKNIAANEYLFASYREKPLSDMAMSRFMDRHGYEYRPHGFRSSFRTWCEEQTDADFAVKEMALGHKVDVGVVGAYQRSDRLEKRRILMENWTNFLVL